MSEPVQDEIELLYVESQSAKMEAQHIRAKLDATRGEGPDYKALIKQYETAVELVVVTASAFKKAAEGLREAL